MILLTRPHADSLQLAKVLGLENCVIAPMLEIEQLKFQINNPYQAIVSTSKNVEYDVNISIPQQGKNAAEILQYCLENLSSSAGKIIYLSGDVVTLDIAAELRKHGFDAERIIAYKQIPAKKIAADLSEITIASFFSSQTLLNFKALANDRDLGKISCVCISEKVAQTARKMGWKNIHIAKKTNATGMIAAIQEASLP
jgi:uroporphyrinogen-III synthase